MTAPDREGGLFPPQVYLKFNIFLIKSNLYINITNIIYAFKKNFIKY